jgi:hypothetical protein
MSTPAADLNEVVSHTLPKLRALSEKEVMRSRGAGKWVKKEILGHVIDSAVNNHQRFVRAQMGQQLVWPGYEQDTWVAVQKYRERPWTEIVSLWEQMNRHLTHVMANVPAERLDTKCIIGDGQPVTLEWLMSDYVRHLRHHLDQIFG